MSMNIYRICGDMSHVIAILILLYALFGKQDARGFSCRTQELFLLVFLTRYIDLFTTYYSFYNSCMKIMYILTSIWVVFSLHFPHGRLRDTCFQEESFHHLARLVIPSLVVAIVAFELSSYDYGGIFYVSGFINLLWTFSIIQESVAMVPQLILMHYCRDMGPYASRYVFFMWLYRTLYIFNWVYRAYHDFLFHHVYLVYFCGVLQSVIIVVAYVVGLRTSRPDNAAGENQIDDIAAGLGYELLRDGAQTDGTSDGGIELRYEETSCFVTTNESSKESEMRISCAPEESQASQIDNGQNHHKS